MGRDKAVLQLDGRTLLEHALRTVREACGSAVILGSRELYGNYGVEVVEDIYPGCGPLSGIHAALTHTRTEFNLMIAVDTPFLSADFLRFMVERAVEARAMVTTPEIGGYRQPLCSVYSREFLAIAEKALQPQRAQRNTEECQGLPRIDADPRQAPRLAGAGAGTGERGSGILTAETRRTARIQK